MLRSPSEPVPTQTRSGSLAATRIAPIDGVEKNPSLTLLDAAAGGRATAARRADAAIRQRVEVGEVLGGGRKGEKKGRRERDEGTAGHRLLRTEGADTIRTAHDDRRAFRRFPVSPSSHRETAPQPRYPAVP